MGCLNYPKRYPLPSPLPCDTQVISLPENLPKMLQYIMCMLLCVSPAVCTVQFHCPEHLSAPIIGSFAGKMGGHFVTPSAHGPDTHGNVAFKCPIHNRILTTMRQSEKRCQDYIAELKSYEARPAFRGTKLVYPS